MANGPAPYHAHIYYSADERPAAQTLRQQFLDSVNGEGAEILFVGQMIDRGVGPHPIPQYEIHFVEPSLAMVMAAIEGSGLRALVHPLTDDDVADHTTLARWIGEPLKLEIGVLDPPGLNQGLSRFGKTDF